MKKRHMAEQIVGKLREAEVDFQNRKVASEHGMGL